MEKDELEDGPLDLCPAELLTAHEGALEARFLLAVPTREVGLLGSEGGPDLHVKPALFAVALDPRLAIAGVGLNGPPGV